MDMQTQLQQIFAKTWSDEAFKAELQQNPAQTLREMGIDVPEGKTITVLVDDERKQHLVIPQQPDNLSDEDMDVAAGGEFQVACWFRPYY